MRTPAWLATVRRGTLFGIGVVPMMSLSLLPFANAGTISSVYSYTLSGFSGSTVPNAASTKAVPLRLLGSWSLQNPGVHFAGDTVSKVSAGIAKPSSGSTLNVPATQSIGFGIRFVFHAPKTGGCFSDSHNLTQVGRFGAGLAQVKIQLSNCSIAKTAVFPQCRMAGSHSTTNDLPKTATQPLVNGATYVVTCYKAPDPVTGSATLTLTTANVNTGAATTDNYAITRPGAINSTEYLSVANKYPFPSISKNTDQFVGEVAKVAYCQAVTLIEVTTCLSSELPTN